MGGQNASVRPEDRRVFAKPSYAGETEKRQKKGSRSPPCETCVFRFARSDVEQEVLALPRADDLQIGVILGALDLKIDPHEVRPQHFLHLGGVLQ